jgi:hypothetical protein
MSYFQTRFYDPSRRDIGEIFVDLCNNQIIQGTKTFTTTPIISGLVIPIYVDYTETRDNLIPVPTGVKYCDIEICGGGGGGGGGIAQSVPDYLNDITFIFGGAGGAGGTYYKITLNVSNYKTYKIQCGNGGDGGYGFYYSNPNNNSDGKEGGTTSIEFYDDVDSLAYKIDALGGQGGQGGKTTIFDLDTVPPIVGTNLVYNNNGSIYKFSSKIANILNPYSFQGVLYIFKYCMLYRIFETNGSVILINEIVFLNKCLPTDPSVGTNKG